MARDDLDGKRSLCFYFPQTFYCRQHLTISLDNNTALASIQGIPGLAVATKTSILIWKPINFVINVSIRLSPG